MRSSRSVHATSVCEHPLYAKGEKGSVLLHVGRIVFPVGALLELNIFRVLKGGKREIKKERGKVIRAGREPRFLKFTHVVRGSVESRTDRHVFGSDRGGNEISCDTTDSAWCNVRSHCSTSSEASPQ